MSFEKEVEGGGIHVRDRFSLECSVSNLPDTRSYTHKWVSAWEKALKHTHESWAHAQQLKFTINRYGEDIKLYFLKNVHS
jgi:hypothetical protein